MFPYKLVGIGVAVLVLIGAFGFLIHSRDSYRDKAATNEQLYHGEQAAHRLTVANYRAQAEVARKADADNKAKVEADQRAINESTDHEYEARIADARSRANRLQQQVTAARSHPSSPGTAPVSIVSGGPSSAPSPAAEGQLSAPDALTATEQSIQLDELIKWVDGQSAVRR